RVRAAARARHAHALGARADAADALRAPVVARAGLVDRPRRAVRSSCSTISRIYFNARAAGGRWPRRPRAFSPPNASRSCTSNLVEGGRRRADIKSRTGWVSFDLP